MRRVRLTAKIDPNGLAENARKLSERMLERFPDRNLTTRSAELVSVIEDAPRRARQMARRPWFLTFVTAVLLCACVAGAVFGLMQLHVAMNVSTLSELLQILDSGWQSLLIAFFFSLGLFYPVRRWRRSKFLKATNELQEFVQVINLHQLDKDPDQLTKDYNPTAPQRADNRPLNAFEMGRYLDYCIELIELTGMLAAYYSSFTSDSDVRKEIAEHQGVIQRMVTNLQLKIQMLHQLAASGLLKETAIVPAPIQPAVIEAEDAADETLPPESAPAVG